MLFILSDLRNVFSSVNPTLKLRLSRTTGKKREIVQSDMTITVRVFSWFTSTLSVFL